MHPPVAPSVLKANPKFEALYRDLCKTKLNKDGTSKPTDRVQKERAIVTHDLRQLRIEAAKADIVKHELSNLAASANALPIELQELVEVLSALLSGELTDKDSDVVDLQLETLRKNARKIAKALSSQLQYDSGILASIVDSENPPQAIEMPSSARQIKSSISDLSEELGLLRLSLTHDAVKLRNLQSEVIETSIRLLEQNIYGLVARSSKAKAEYLSLMAEGMEKKLTLQHEQLLSQVNSPTVKESLSDKCEELELEVRAVKRKIEKATKELEAYEKESTVRQMAKEYSELKIETERVQVEIARLEDDY